MSRPYKNSVKGLSQCNLLVNRIWELGGSSIASFAWGLGNISNNIVEAYALWEGVHIARDRNIANIVILGDSMMVVRAVIKRAQMENNAFNCIISHILSLLVEFDKVKIYHIKRELNSQAYYWAKFGVNMDEGLIDISGVWGSSPSLKSRFLSL
jgi:ribonuclease HI